MGTLASAPESVNCAGLPQLPDTKRYQEAICFSNGILEMVSHVLCTPLSGSSHLRHLAPLFFVVGSSCLVSTGGFMLFYVVLFQVGSIAQLRCRDCIM